VFNSSKTNAIRALVAMTFADGRTDMVSVRLSLTSKLHDALNSADAFLDVVNGAGKQYFVAKSSIASVELIEVPKAGQMNMQRRTIDREQFDPYKILGVASDAEQDAIRQAYHAMVKAYHPDRFSALDLPKEMKDYAAAMLVRINLAYEQIGG
jgi:DnaJ-domain-containing protein 1